MSESKKPITKICIKCVEANKALGNVNSNFKIQCEYGACDVCGEHYVIVPFGRYFQPNAKVEPHLKEIKADVYKVVEQLGKEVAKLQNKINIISKTNDKKNK